MKTIKQWLKEGLSKEDYKKAKKYKTEHWKTLATDFRAALNSAFIWIETEEGQDYWSEIYHNGGSIEISNDEKLECAYAKFGVSTGVLPKIYPKVEAEQTITITKREYFAGLALQGLLSSFTEMAANGDWGTGIKETASVAIAYADELLKQLEK